jgi:hypothetical protein
VNTMNHATSSSRRHHRALTHRACARNRSLADAR